MIVLQYSRAWDAVSSVSDDASATARTYIGLGVFYWRIRSRMTVTGTLSASIKKVFITMDERETGVVKWFNNQKGYGFISRESGEDVFVHHSAIVEEGFRTMSEGDRVEFSVQDGDKGPAAVDVTW